MKKAYNLYFLISKLNFRVIRLIIEGGKDKEKEFLEKKINELEAIFYSI